MRLRLLPCLSLFALTLALPVRIEAGCQTCQDTGEMACVSCGGAKPTAFPCTGCKGAGSFACKACEGKGGSPCTTCVAGAQGNPVTPVVTSTDKCGVCDRTGTIDCPSCTAGSIDCASCAGRREIARLCPACAGGGKVACPDCKAGGPCPGCGGAKKSECVTCEMTGSRATTCAACLGSRGVLCQTCKGSGRASCRECHGDGVCHGARGAFACQLCGRRGYLACKKCSGRAATPCAGCKGKGQIVEKCAACKGEKKAACMYCRSGRAWSATDELTGATVWLFSLDDFEPHVAMELTGAISPPRPAWRLVVDARAANGPVEVGSSTGMRLFLAPGPSKEIDLGSLASAEGILEALRSVWVSEDMLQMPVTAAAGEVRSRVVCAASAPPSGTLRIRMRSARDGKTADADLKPAQAGAIDRLRLLLAARGEER